MTPVARLIALLIMTACLALLTTAAVLSPSSNGSGTHQQLGLPACAWLQHMNLPCPACGMTTSFSWFMHGNVLASFYVQPMGMLLALGCGMLAWAAAYVFMTGHPVYRVFSRIPEKYYLIPLLCMAMAGWAWKMFIHLHGIDGWK